jgi:DedD protein
VATTRNKITFELSRAALALIAVAGFVALLWMFVFGVFIGRRYSPDTYVPHLAAREAEPPRPPARPPAPQPAEAAPAVPVELKESAPPGQAPASPLPVMALCQVPASAKAPEAEKFATEMARHKEEAQQGTQAQKPRKGEPDKAKKLVAAKLAPAKNVAAKPVAAPEPKRIDTAAFAVQVGAFGEEDRARAMVAQLEKAGYRAYLFRGKTNPKFRVRLGPYTKRQDAERAAASVGAKLGLKPYLLTPGGDLQGQRPPNLNWRG